MRYSPLLFPAVLVVCAADEPFDEDSAASSPPPVAPITLHSSELEPLFEMPEALQEALAQRDHSTAADLLTAQDRSALSGAVVADQAFLQSWELLRAGRGEEAVQLLVAIERAEHVPQPYLDLTVGELLLHNDQPVEAAQRLAQVPKDSIIWVRAQLSAATALQKSGATASALAIYTALAARPDPADGSEKALWALASRAGLSSPAAYPYLRRLWSRYPRTAEGKKAAEALPEHEARGSAYRASDLELALRGEAMMRDYAFDSAAKLIGPQLARFSTPSEASCIAWYTYGRSKFKRNSVTEAARVLSPAGEKCAGIDNDRGAKSLYIAGKALERKKDWAGAARVYERIPALYPAHTMADDGYTLAGIGWQEAGQLDKAMALWSQQVQSYPEGDLAAEGFWRLAWSSYRQGDPEAAITWAESMIWTVPVTTDPVHVLGGQYWAARWKLYPDVSSPATLTTDPERRRRAVADLASLCREHTSSFFAILAAARLYELSPASLDDIARPAFTGQPDTWDVPVALMELSGLRSALALARLGLISESLDELAALDTDVLGPTGAGIRAQIEARRDPIVAHDRIHKYLLSHPPSTITANQLPILQTAYPNLYWDLTQQAAEGYGFDPRIFHALVREESSFNKDIVSWAGARGLSQLMPATAKQVGGWLGMKVSKQTSFDPLSNLRIGTRYMEYLQQRFSGNMFLAVAGYNAGEGNVEKWLREKGNLPTDEFIESIPYRETRGYVKRVLGTWQVYRTLYDDGPPFADFSAYNHVAKVD